MHADRRDWRLAPRGLGLLAALGVIGLLFANTQLGSTFGAAWVDAQVRGHGLVGEVLFVCVAGMLTAVGVPRQLVSFLGGYAFGLIFGSALAVLATLIGCAASFYCARLLGRAYVVRRFSGRVHRLDDFIRRHPLGMTLLIRLSPVGNNLITNLLAGVTSVRPATFFAGSAIGYIPQTMVFALGGSGAHVDPVLRIALSVILFILFGALGAWLLGKFRHGKPLDFGVQPALNDASELRA